MALGCWSVIAIIGVVVGIALIAAGQEAIGVACSIVWAILLIAIINGFRNQTKSEREKAKEAETRLNLIKAGNWELPVDEFFSLCKKNGVTSLDDEYHLKKAALIAREILNSHSIPQEYQELYLTADKLNQYFSLGIKNEEIRLAAEQEEYKIKLSTPQEAVLDEKELSEIKFAETLKDFSGNEKRIFMLSTALADDKANLESLNSLGSLAANIRSSAYQKPKNDWALIGGIASGIAGPAAGAAAAGNAMLKNQEIEKENAANKAFANHLANTISNASLSDEILDRKFKLHESIKRYERLLEEAKLKVVFDEATSEELFSSLKISTKTILSKNKLQFDLQIQNTYSTTVAPSIEKVTDGTLQAKIYCDDILVDDVCVAMPQLGLKLDNKTNIRITSRKFMIGNDRNYRLEFSPNKLWLMEL